MLHKGGYPSCLPVAWSPSKGGWRTRKSASGKRVAPFVYLLAKKEPCYNMQATTKTCPHCRSEINAKASKCPQCQADLRNWFSRHKVLTALLLFFGLPIIIGIASSSTDSARQKSAEIKNQNSGQPASQATTSGGDWESMKVGDQGYLRIPGYVGADQNICLGKTTKDAEAIGKALLAKDFLGLLEIPGAFCVGNGSKVQLIDKSFPYRRVRILAGVNDVDKDKVGLSGYLPAEWVVSK